MAQVPEVRAEVFEERTSGGPPMTPSTLTYDLHHLLNRAYHGCGAADCHAAPVVKPDPEAKCACRATLALELRNLAAKIEKEGIKA
jgi:hypothetical protein